MSYCIQHYHTDVVDCFPTACLNGGTCIDGLNAFTCACSPGFTGQQCDIGMDALKTFACYAEVRLSRKACMCHKNDARPIYRRRKHHS